MYLSLYCNKAVQEKQERISKAVRRIGKVCLNYNVRGVSRILNQRYDSYLSKCGLTSVQFSILSSIISYDAISINDLALMLSMDRTTLSRNLKAIEEKGYVCEVTDRDRRSRKLKITDAGLIAVEQAIPLWKKAQHEAMMLAGPFNYVPLLTYLKKFIHNSRKKLA